MPASVAGPDERHRAVGVLHALVRHLDHVGQIFEHVGAAQQTGPVADERPDDVLHEVHRPDP